MATAIFDKELLQDWCDYCEGKKEFDSCHFSTLMMETLLEGFTPELDKFLHEITKYFDDSIYSTLVKTFSEKPQGENDITYWVERDIREKIKACPSSSNSSIILGIIDNGHFEITSDYQKLQNARMTDNNTILHESSGDIASNGLASDNRLYALDEIFYNIASDYDLVHALMSGVIKGEIDFSNYLEIYKRGFDYAVGNDQVVIYQHQK
jgi:hypothetical protein